MAKKAKKKKLDLERERLRNRTALFTLVAASMAPIAGIIDLIKVIVKHFLK